MSERQPWAVYDRKGKLLFLDLAENEDHVWQIWLGWPSKDDIEDAKHRGEQAIRVSVTPRGFLNTAEAAA
jgi:hypothetical protein